jgi:hypothetical protein
MRHVLFVPLAAELHGTQEVGGPAIAAWVGDKRGLRSMQGVKGARQWQIEVSRRFDQGDRYKQHDGRMGYGRTGGTLDSCACVR